MPTKKCSTWTFPATCFIHISIESLAKASKLFTSKLRLERDKEELWAKIWLYRQSVTKSIPKAKKIKQNCTARKVNVLEVILVCISPYSAQMRENTDRIAPNTETFYAVLDKTRKRWYLLLPKFWPLLPKIIFLERRPSFSNFLRSCV